MRRLVAQQINLANYLRIPAYREASISYDAVHTSFELSVQISLLLPGFWRGGRISGGSIVWHNRSKTTTYLTDMTLLLEGTSFKIGLMRMICLPSSSAACTYTGLTSQEEAQVICRSPRSLDQSSGRLTHNLEKLGKSALRMSVCKLCM